MFYLGRIDFEQGFENKNFKYKKYNIKEIQETLKDIKFPIKQNAPTSLAQLV